MNKPLTASIVALFLLAALLAGGQTAPSQSVSTKPKLTDEVFKNIKVLKGIPADQLIPAMQFITSSLGVECSFCHVEGAFEKDDKKPKQAARKMMQMMFAINQDNFESHREVTCYTCHRGSIHPVATPVIVETPTQPIATAPDEHEPAPPEMQPEQIFGKYVDALGGASAIEKLSTRAEKGTVDLSGHQFSIDILSKAPDKRISIIHLPNGDNVTAYNGISGWTSAPNRPIRELPASEVTSARLEADLQLPIRFKQFFSDLKTEKPEKIGDRDVYVVTGLNAGTPTAKFYFDKQSSLLLRLLRYVDSPLGHNPTQIDYSEYREQAGAKMPFQRTIARPGSRFTIRIEQIQDNVPVDDAKFVRPVEPEPQKPTSP